MEAELDVRSPQKSFEINHGPRRVGFGSSSRMKKAVSIIITVIVAVIVALGAARLFALPQSAGTAGSVEGTVVDPSEAVVPGASVKIENAVTGYKRAATTDADGVFRFNGVPPNEYQLTVEASGFVVERQGISVRTQVPISLKISLSLASLESTVTVQSSANVVESVPMTHTDVDQSLISKLPVSTPGSGLSDVVTMAAPGVVSDSNGFFHPLGDHAQTTLSLDGQPISDQQSKAFSTQIPVNAIQSLEVITGAPPAEYGDKTSLVISAITRSGLNQQKPNGSLTTLYGTYGTSQTEATLAAGGARVGNFSAFTFERTGRFLDTPELTVLHDRGKSASVFNRFDFNPNSKNAFHLNLTLARNRFEIPNQFDQQALAQDQRQLVRSLNIAPGYVHIFSETTLLTVSPYYRLDQVWYRSSPDAFSDRPQTFAQQRRLADAGIRADVAYAHGIHNAKFGVQFSHTLLTEAFQFGITDPTFNDPASADFLPGLLPFDLTRGGHLFTFNSHTDIKREALYAQDSMTLGGLTISAGLRFDHYQGLSRDQGVQPRIGVSYLFKPTNTVVRGSYSRTFETPFNENLLLSSSAGAGGLADGLLGAASSNPLKPGRRNQFNIGFQQGLGRFVIVDIDYFWKFTNRAFDFSTLLNTPLAFPIVWDHSNVDGVSLHANVTNYKGLTLFFNGGHSRARFFPPENGGLFFNSALPSGVFRIDHDEAFQQTTQVQYQFHQVKKIEPYIALTWRYDSGLVAGSVPDFASALTLTPDQQAQIGLFCGQTFATPTEGLTACHQPIRGALRLRIPANGTANDDHNPPRIAPRHLFDLSVGSDNLLRTEPVHVSLRLTVFNLTDRQALYNFLSTFSGTHFVSPRSYQVQVGLTF